MINTSQDPDYVGAVGHEKRFHKTHFDVIRTLKRRKPKPTDKFEWVKIGVGKYKLVRKEQSHAEI